jgi:hypothetical protein
VSVRALLIQALASVAGGVLLTRLLYATEPGQALLGRVPEALWQSVLGAFGVQGAEGTRTAEGLLVLLACVLLSALVVALGVRVLAPALRRRRGR